MSVETHDDGGLINADSCLVDDPELWKTQPVTLQIVGRPCRDEALIATAESIDQTVNGEPTRVSPNL